ncbi:MAG: ABC-type transport auxiliary lipoprotein family protein [Steroidobacterales bacterium]
MNPTLKITVAGVLACVAAACTGSLFKTQLPVTQTYQLGALQPQAAAAATLDVLLLVARPIVAPGLDTDHIALVHPGRRLDYYAGGTWGAPAPEVIQNVVVASLQNTGRLRGVQRDLANFRPDFVLQLDVRAFQAEYADGGAPHVRVDLIATIGRLNERRSVLSFAAVSDEPAAANTMTEVTAAFDRALQVATGTLLAQVIDYVGRESSARKARPPDSTPPSQ